MYLKMKEMHVDKTTECIFHVVTNLRCSDVRRRIWCCLRFLKEIMSNCFRRLVVTVQKRKNFRKRRHEIHCQVLWKAMTKWLTFVTHTVNLGLYMADTPTSLSVLHFLDSHITTWHTIFTPHCSPNISTTTSGVWSPYYNYIYVVTNSTWDFRLAHWIVIE